MTTEEIKKIKIETIETIWRKAQAVIDVRGHFFYIDLLQILQEVKREADNDE